MNGDSAGLPTSLTICPSCGANLHVPERMVGSIVHCSECGKPFHVEEGSEVMQVAQPAHWPLRPRFCWRRKLLRGCLGIAAGSIMLLFVLLLFLGVSYQVAKKPLSVPARSLSGPQALPPWKRMLQWLPAEATLFGAIDLKPFGSLTLDDSSMQALLRLAVPEEAANKLTSENLGRIQIHGAALACYEDAKSGTNEALVLLEGKIWSGRKRIIDFIRQDQTKKIHVEEKTIRVLPTTSTLLSGPTLPFALYLRDDEHVFLARPLNKDATESQNLKALERLPEVGTRPNIYLFSGGNLSSYDHNTQWIYEAVGKIPTNACSVFLGEIPPVWRRALTDALNLRVCPRTFVLHMRKEGQSVVASLTLNLDIAGTDGILRDDLEKWRLQGLHELQTRFPALKRDRQASALLEQILNSARWTANGGSVQTQVRIPAPDWKALGKAR